MSDKYRSPLTCGSPKPVPMRLFSTWEVDSTPPNCIPRLCSLTLTRLIVTRPLGPDVNSITVSVKIQVLQKQMDIELDLLSEDKDFKGNICARVFVHGLNSQPTDSDNCSKLAPLSGGRLENYYEDDEDYTSNDDASDSEPIESKKNVPPSAVRQRNLKQKFISLLKKFTLNEDLQLDTDHTKLTEGDMDPADIEDLIDELDFSDSGPELDTMSIISTPKPSLRPFFSSSKSLLTDPLLSDPNEKYPEKGSDESSKRADSDSHPESDHTPSACSPPKFDRSRKETIEKEKKPRFLSRDKSSSLKKKAIAANTGSQNSSPQGGFENPDIPTVFDLPEQKQIKLDQIYNLLPKDEWLPEYFFIVNTCDHIGQTVASNLLVENFKVVSTNAPGDVKTFIGFLINKIQTFCNNNSKPPPLLKLITVGSDSFLNSIIRNYVEHLSAKPPDWQGYIRFLIVPLGVSTVSKYLGTIDNLYNKLFVSETWHDAMEKEDTIEILNRIQRYMQQSNTVVNLAIAEAMLTCKERSSTDDSTQIFIPFVSDVRLGSDEFLSAASLDLDESSVPSGSPPHSDRKVSPPSSPNMSLLMAPNKDNCDALELQVDYWLSPLRPTEGRPDSGNKGKHENTKSTIKSAFRSLQVLRLGNVGELPSSYFTIVYSAKEKNRKIMRLGKRKEKDKDDQKNGSIDGVVRLICSPKAHNVPLKWFRFRLK